MGQPFVLHVAEHYAATIALCQGRLAEAEAAAQRSHEWSRLLTGRDPSGVYGIQMFSIRREQGRLVELAPVVRVLASGDRPHGAWRPGLAAMLAELGRDDDVRRDLDRIVAEGLEPLRESLWLASLTYLSDAAAAVGHERIAGLVYPELAAYRGKNVMIGYGVACYGSADRYLGMLASTLGEWEAADLHFADALELNRAMGATTWLGHTTYEYARMLRARGGRDDRARSSELVAEAARIAESTGLPSLAARARAFEPFPAARAELHDGLSPREILVLRLVTQGLSNREIGRELVISEHTAANHVRSILRKTGCANRTEAASYAHRHGLAGP
jgi:DNA-binding CsgD family transcriptional regulator